MPTCTVPGCNCVDSTTPSTAKFCAICGHAMQDHARPTQATMIQRSCNRCGCANFVGAPNAQFCAACGHGAIDHTGAREALVPALQQTAPAAPVVAAPPAVPRAPFPTRKVGTVAGIIAIAVILIVGTTFGLTWLSQRADEGSTDGQAALVRAQDELNGLTGDVERVRKDIDDAKSATAKLEKQAASAQRNRSRIPRQIAALRAQQRTLRQQLKDADYTPQA